MDLLRFVVLSVAAMGALLWSAWARPLNLEHIASAPFPAHLTAAPTSDSVAWVYNERGVRNIWVASLVANGKPYSRRLTSYAGDDGIDISALAWTGDGASLIYVRGGDAGGRTAVNPQSEATGPSVGSLYAIAAVGGVPRLLGNGYAPAPNGDLIVFAQNGQPFFVHTERGDPVRAWVDRGTVSDFRWSPDGTKLAFVSTRPQHALIGVFDLARKAITWLAPGFDMDREPVWSPDGKRLAFLRLPSDGLGRSRYIANREGYPWEIWIADVTTGAGKRRWRADPGIGSRFRELFNSDSSLFWMTDGSLYFPWEKTGWLRLYALPANGERPRLLTPGDAEIFGAQQSVDRTRLIYSSNLGALDQRHIWSIDHDGAPRQITQGEGIEDLPVITANKRVFVLRGDARYPLRPALVGASGMTDIATEAIATDFPSDELVTPELITFEAPDGVTVHGQLFVPKGRTTKGPALIFFHGGPTNRQMFAAWDPFETHTRLYEANQYLTSRGYIVLSVNYRGGAGYGLNFREAKDFGAGGASELNDIVAAAEYLIHRPDVDPARLGIWGGSYGGRMTLLGLSAASKYFAAGASYAGIYDFTRQPGFKGDAAARRRAIESAAVGRMDRWRAPVLLMHADADVSVPFDQTALLAEALRQRNVPYETLMIPDEVHFLLRHQSWMTILEATREFMDRHLKKWALPANMSAS